MKEKIFQYLENLRKSGEINMFESPARVKAEFNLSIEEAMSIVTEWMNRYQELAQKYNW